MRNLLYLIIFFLFLACSYDKVYTDLKRAESVMDAHPDSANIILEGIDVASLRDDENRALYALLLTRARDKMKMYDMSDSLIDVAVEFYGEEDNLNSCMANFYKGAINFYSGNYRNAITYSTKALYIAQKLNNDYWQAKSHELIADIFQVTYGEEEALSNRRKAAEFYKKSAKPDNELFAYIQICDYISSNKGDYAYSINLLDSVRYLTVGMDSDIIASYLDSYIFPLSRLGRYEEALDYYYHSQNYKTRAYYLTDLEEIAEIYFHLGNEDSMKHYLERVRENPYVDYLDNSMYHFVLGNVARKKGDVDSALKEENRMLVIDQRKTSNALKQEIALLQRDEYSEKARYERERKSEIVIYGSIGIVLLATICLLVIITYRQKLKIKETQLGEKVAESTLLMEEIEETKSRLSSEQDERRQMESELFREKGKMEETVRRLFREQFTVIDGIQSEYYSKRDAPGMRAKIADDLDRAISNISSGDNLTELESIIDSYNDGVVAKLREQVSPLDERSVKLLILSAAGFSMRSISLITGISIGNINNIWYRLKKRVADSSAPDRDLILSLFRR